MIIGSFGDTSGWAGRQVEYDNGRFSVNGEPFSLEDLLAADQQGLIVWAYDGLQEWARQLSAVQSAVPAPAPLAEAAAAPVVPEPAPAVPEASRPSPVLATPSPDSKSPQARRRLRTRTKVIIGVVGAFVIFTAIGAIGNAIAPKHKTSHLAASPVAKSAAPTASWTKVASWSGAAASLTDTGQYVWTIAVLRKGQNPNSSAAPVLLVTGQLGGGSLSSANSGACDLQLRPEEQYYVWAELHNCSAAVAVSQRGSASGTAWNGVPATPGPVAVASPMPSSPMSPDQQGATSFIRNAGADTRRVQANVQFVQVALAIAEKTPTQANVDQLAQTAQQAHDNIDAIRGDFATVVTSRAGSLQYAETTLFTAANDLKYAMGALVAYTGTPNAATLAHFTTQYDTARAEWNDSVRTIWHLAHEKNPPTI